MRLNVLIPRLRISIRIAYPDKIGKNIGFRKFCFSVRCTTISDWFPLILKCTRSHRTHYTITLLSTMYVSTHELFKTSNDQVRPALLQCII